MCAWHVGLFRRYAPINRSLPAQINLYTRYSTNFEAPSRRATKKSTKNDQAFADLVPAMQHFHHHYQHFLVPYTFKIPTETSAWPESLKGMKLGRTLWNFMKKAANSTKSNQYDAIRQQLDQIGFPLIHDWKRYNWQHVCLAALQTYKQLQGNLRIPRTFVVPHHDSQWPRPTWGFRLGSQVNTLRSTKGKLENYQVQDLDEIGFIWNVTDAKWDQLFLPALRTFYKLNGHSDVPQAFVVASDGDKQAENWPEELRGFKLGAMVNHIRSGVVYGPQIARSGAELARLEFSFNTLEKSWSEKVLPALEAFYQVYHHCNIPTYFVVPDEEPWPKKAWGLKLGFVVQNIRNRGDYFYLVARDSARLEQIEFVWDTLLAQWMQCILPALRTFVDVHGDAAVAKDFVVPSEHPWPEKAYGFKLGQFVHNIHRRSKFANYIEIDCEQLEALGFFWSVMPDDDEDEDEDYDVEEEEEEEDI